MTTYDNSALVVNALSYVGTKEIPGQRHNPVIVNMLKSVASWVNDDETAWCSAFMNYIATQTGLQSSGRLDARSWLNVGEAVDVPIIGDVVVFWRDSPESWKGHVAIFIRSDGKNVWVLGGNQSNEVNISIYPASRVLGYRRLKLK